MPGGGLHEITASVVKSWPRPDFEDPTQRSWFPPYAIALQGITTALLFARLWSRFRRYSGHLGVDDLLIFVGWIFATILTIAYVFGTFKYGFDRHLWDVPRENWEVAAFITWLSTIVFLAGGCFVKCSILLFYRRLIGITYSKAWVWATWAGMALTVIYSVALIVTLFVICLPFGTYWETFDPSFSSPATCLNERGFWLAAGVLAVFSDFYALLMPSLLLWRLDMTRAQRAGLVVIFVLALGAIGSGIARAYYLSVFDIFTNADLTWLQFPVFVTSQFEIQAAIICACAPSLRAFVSETVKQPIQTAYRRGSKHISLSLDKIYSNGSRLHHPHNADQKPNPSSPQGARHNHHNKSSSPRASEERTTANAGSGSPRRNDSAMSNHPVASPALNTITTPPLKSGLKSTHYHPHNHRRQSRSASPKTPKSKPSTEELQERARQKNLEKLREERDREAEAEAEETSTSAEATNASRLQHHRSTASAVRGATPPLRGYTTTTITAGEPLPVLADMPGWHQGLSTKDAFDRYRKGQFGPLPPPKDLGSSLPESPMTTRTTKGNKWRVADMV